MSQESLNSSSSTPSSNDPQELPPKIIKLLKRVRLFKNPFAVLKSKRTDDIEDIRKRYKKLALLVHPDKCKHPDAEEAFNALSLAMKRIEDDKERTIYSELTEKAENIVTEEWKKIGKKREREEDEELFYEQVYRETQKKIIDFEQQKKRAEEMVAKNEERVKLEKQKLENEKKQQEEWQKKWDEGREERVNSWRNFNNKQQRLKKRKLSNQTNS